jgi:phage terminase Nu1 subunit (DNA packaging protein)
MKTTNVLLAAILLALLANVIAVHRREVPAAAPSTGIDEKRWVLTKAKIQAAEAEQKLADGATIAEIENEAARNLVTRVKAAEAGAAVVERREQKFERLRQRAFEEEMLLRVAGR